MGHSLISQYIHLVFSTKNREKVLQPGIREHLWKVIAGIAKNNNIEAVVVGGYDDHCHALLSLPATISIAEAAKILKATSSKWLSGQYPELTSFSWQKGYSAFSVSFSNVPKVIAYINAQEDHHGHYDFQTEYFSLLRKHEIPFDPLELD